MNEKSTTGCNLFTTTLPQRFNLMRRTAGECLAGFAPMPFRNFHWKVYGPTIGDSDGRHVAPENGCVSSPEAALPTEE